MRVGKFVEHFRAAAIASDAVSMDPVLRFTAVGRQLGYAMYMLMDNAVVLDATGIKKSSWGARISREAYRAWFAGLSFSIISGVYSMYNLSLRQKAVISSSEPELIAVRVQLLSDLCDVTIPSSALGWVGLDDGIVGLAGTTSSLLGVWGQWKKTA
jgi:peroxin-11B